MRMLRNKQTIECIRLHCSLLLFCTYDTLPRLMLQHKAAMVSIRTECDNNLTIYERPAVVVDIVIVIIEKETPVGAWLPCHTSLNMTLGISHHSPSHCSTSHWGELEQRNYYLLSCQSVNNYLFCMVRIVRTETSNK